MLRLRVSRTVVVFEGPSRASESTSAVVALTVDRGRVGICSVGESEEDMLARMRQEHEAAGRSALANTLMAAAKLRADVPPAAAPTFRIVRPGEDAWWDVRIDDPYSWRKGEHERSHDPRQVLVVWPLSERTWSPHLIRGLLMYVLWSSPWTRTHTWPPFFRPHVELLVDASITGVEREELTDTLRSLWGASRVHLPPGHDVPPLPMTRLRAVHHATRALWWIAAVLMVVLARPEPGGGAVVAAAIAAAALFTSRVLAARLQAERPRRASGRVVTATSR